jgi:hypothetical protein
LATLSTKRRACATAADVDRWHAPPHCSIIASMPFFEHAPPPLPEESHATERIWLPPRWDRPSEGTLPAIVGATQIFARTENAAFALEHVRVYPNGFQLVVTMISNPRIAPEFEMGGFATFGTLAVTKADASDASDPSDTPTPPPAAPPRRRLGPSRFFEMTPRVGIRFSNGHTAGTKEHASFDTPRDVDGVPTEPVIVEGGFNGSGGNVRFQYWVFPLPTPGPLEVFAEWTHAGIEETSIVLSGDDIRNAAQRAIVLWS